jgi:hypothetical protein
MDGEEIWRTDENSKRPKRSQQWRDLDGEQWGEKGRRKSPEREKSFDLKSETDRRIRTDWKKTSNQGNSAEWSSSVSMYAADARSTRRRRASNLRGGGASESPVCAATRSRKICFHVKEIVWFFAVLGGGYRVYKESYSLEKGKKYNRNHTFLPSFTFFFDSLS